jgi:hypothetical protein
MKLDLTFFLSAAIGAQIVFGTPIRSRMPYSVKETHNVPRGWKNLGRAAGDHKLHLQIGLKQEKFAELGRHLYEGRSSKIFHYLRGNLGPGTCSQMNFDIEQVKAAQLAFSLEI